MTSQRSNRIFISDCEGPISKNDNAFELASHFIPNGGDFFALLSRYDDVLADVIRRPSYKAGDTLKLILPFLKAYGATNANIREFSSKSILLVPGAVEMLRHVRKVMPSFIVSTSYEQYISALCSLNQFPYENVYCTRLDLDRFGASSEEIDRLKQLREEIATLPMIEIPEGSKSLRGFALRDQETVRRLDAIFWEEMPKMAVGSLLRDVNPIGGYEKARAVEDIVSRFRCSPGDVVYVGDSITDAPPLRLVRESGGLAVAFNGNEYAIREADVAVLSNNAMVTAILADCFWRFGREYAIRLVEEWSRPALERYCVDVELRRRVLQLFPDELPKVEFIEESNKERLMKESSGFRKTVRGEAIGGLG